MRARAIIIGLFALCVAPAAAETLQERGDYLVNTILACGNCHTPKGPDGAAIRERELSGGLSFNTPAFRATASNITPDRETGIGAWSDDDIKRALVEGVRPPHARLPGVPLAAVMPVSFYKALLPRDLDAVVAYLRSLKPVQNAVPEPVYLAPVVHQHYPDAQAGFTQASMDDPVRRGVYLATIGHCMECHSKWDRGVSDYQNGFGAGGRPFAPTMVQGFPRDWQGSKAPNITSHPTAGIGAWSDAEIKRAITHGKGRDGRTFQPPMAVAWYAGLSERDQDALVAWLRTVPPLE